MLRLSPSTSAKPIHMLGRLRKHKFSSTAAALAPKIIDSSHLFLPNLSAANSSSATAPTVSPLLLRQPYTSQTLEFIRANSNGTPSNNASNILLVKGKAGAGKSCVVKGAVELVRDWTGKGTGDKTRSLLDEAASKKSKVDAADARSSFVFSCHDENDKDDDNNDTNNNNNDPKPIILEMSLSKNNTMNTTNSLGCKKATSHGVHDLLWYGKYTQPLLKHEHHDEDYVIPNNNKVSE